MYSSDHGESIVQSGSSDVHRYHDSDQSVVVLEYTMHGTVVRTGAPYVNRSISSSLSRTARPWIGATTWTVSGIRCLRHDAGARRADDLHGLADVDERAYRVVRELGDVDRRVPIGTADVARRLPPASAKSPSARPWCVVDVTRMIPDVTASFANGTENCAFCTVLLALSSTMIRIAGKPSSRACPHRRLRSCRRGLPPVTMIGDRGKNCATIRPVSTDDEKSTHRAVGVEAVSENDDRRLRQILGRRRGLSRRSRRRPPPNAAATASAIAPAAVFHSALHASSATVVTDEVRHWSWVASTVCSCYGAFDCDSLRFALDRGVTLRWTQRGHRRESG